MQVIPQRSPPKLPVVTTRITGKNEGNWVSRTGTDNGADGSWLPDTAGNIAVCYGRIDGNGL
ncbi:hypothetical protein [Chroococcidiopsis sp [FACHB-1243]]|uniref:hypothetical protein n=1 Tax=Chroococcidiopsis sp. [FACHB-1243] TaxID=2692781 RepID=UPI001F556C8E|nr:hypothetical protein [Chroococcidiopsis sp. [FACHB-1243]]